MTIDSPKGRVFAAYRDIDGSRETALQYGIVIEDVSRNQSWSSHRIHFLDEESGALFAKWHPWSGILWVYDNRLNADTLESALNACITEICCPRITK